MNEDGAYYYARERGRSEDFVLPVYRVILKDDQQTRYYPDAGTGALVEAPTPPDIGSGGCSADCSARLRRVAAGPAVP